MNLKSCAVEIIGEDDADEFAKWAFGDSYYSLNGFIEFLKAWNTIHENELKLEPSGMVYEDMKKMCTLWRMSQVVD